MVTSGKCRLTLCGCRTKLYRRREGANFHGTMQAMSLTLVRGSNQTKRTSMIILPVDRALSIYGALANRSEAKGARQRLSVHLMKMYIDGEEDEHRLTVEGLTYLHNLNQEIDSRN